MSTKAQKVYAKYIRSTSQAERKLFKGWLDRRHVKMKQVSYLRNGEVYSIHGDIGPITPPDQPKTPSPTRDRRSVPTAKQDAAKTATTPTPPHKRGRVYDESETTPTGFGVNHEPPARQFEVGDYWDAYVRTSPDI